MIENVKNNEKSAKSMILIHRIFEKCKKHQQIKKQRVKNFCKIRKKQKQVEIFNEIRNITTVSVPIEQHS